MEVTVDPMLKAAIELRERGFAVHLLRPKSKVPIQKNWSQAQVKSTEELEQEYRPGLNVGFRAGEPSVIDGDGIIVLDIDIRGGAEYKREAWAACKPFVGDLEPTVRTGSGGAHLYLRCPRDRLPKKAAITLCKSDREIERGKAAWKIEVLSTGKNVVAPPSIHPDTDQPYQWINGGIEHIPVAPDTLLDAIESVGPPDSSGWPEPDPIRTSLLLVDALPPGIIPAPFWRWITDVAYRMQCPPDFVFVATIVMTSSMIGAGCGIRPKRLDDWQVVPNLWGGVVARPGMLKSPSLAAALTPLAILEAEARLEYEAAMHAYEVALEVYEAKKEACKSELRKLAKTNAKSTDFELEQARLADLEPPEKPVWHRYKTNDATVEKMSDLLSETPRGLLLFRDELVGLLASWDKEGHQSDRAFYLEAWSGHGSMTVDRIGRGTVHTEHLCVSILGSVQPAKLVAYLYDAMHSFGNDGLVQRFQLLVYPDEPAGWTLVDEKPDADAKSRAFATINKLAKMNFLEHGAALDAGQRIPHFHFEPEAQDLFNDWLTELQANLQHDEHAIILEHLAKFRSLMPSLALIFHLVDIADGQASGPVSLHATQRAAACCEYLETHARRIYGLVTQLGAEAAKKLAEKLRAGKLEEGFTVRDVLRKEWSMLQERTIVEAACRELEEANWLRPENVEARYGQRPTTRYFINPTVRKRDG